MYPTVHGSTIYSGQELEATLMSIDRWMDREAVARARTHTHTHTHTYTQNGILFSHKKERIWVRCGEVDEARACYREWSKSEREKQIYINTYIWNLEK